LGFELGNGEGGTNGKAARTLSVRDVELVKESLEFLCMGGGKLEYGSIEDLEERLCVVIGGELVPMLFAVLGARG